jgi:hypothetical protein
LPLKLKKIKAEPHNICLNTVKIIRNKMGEVIEGLIKRDAPTLPNAHGDVTINEFFLERAENLSTSLPEILRALPEMADEKLLGTAIHACRLELQGYLIRGACAAELRKRISTKLAGGRGKRDEAKIGVQARLAAFADNIGVDLRTLRTDLRIYQVFFENAPERVSTLAGECPLPREFFVTALAAPQPLAAIKIALRKRQDRNYTRQQYREEILALKQSSGKTKVKIKPRGNCWLRVQISCEANLALEELERKGTRTQGEIVSEALLALHQVSEGASPEIEGSSQKRRRERKSVRSAVTQLPLEYSQKQ